MTHRMFLKEKWAQPCGCVAGAWLLRLWQLSFCSLPSGSLCLTPPTWLLEVQKSAGLYRGARCARLSTKEFETGCWELRIFRVARTN